MNVLAVRETHGVIMQTHNFDFGRNVIHPNRIQWHSTRYRSLVMRQTANSRNRNGGNSLHAQTRLNISRVSETEKDRQIGGERV